jgi:hypothetical protein
LADTRLEKDLITTRGEIRLEGDTRVGGDLRIRKPECWGVCKDDDEPTIVTIGAGVTIAGEIRSERPTELRVHEDARIGPVIGTEVKRFSGERP